MFGDVGENVEAGHQYYVHDLMDLNKASEGFISIPILLHLSAAPPNSHPCKLPRRFNVTVPGGIPTFDQAGKDLEPQIRGESGQRFISGCRS